MFGKKIKNWCKGYDMSVATYYRLHKRSETEGVDFVPPYVKIGRSSLILAEDEAAWLKRLKAGELADDFDAGALVAARQSSQKAA